jgi:hypothetical protein
MFKLRAITVTGADNTVDPAKLLDLGEKYPLAEFGILFGNYKMLDRFPSDKWLHALRKAIVGRKTLPRLSCHLCGHWTEEFLTRQTPFIPDGDLWQRIQVNTHGEAHPVVLTHLLRTLNNLQGRGGVEVIFQRDIQNDPIFDYLLSQSLTGARKYNVSTLFDLSHGAGVLPDVWPRPIDGARCGYAGGLSPANVASQLDKIAEACSKDFGHVTDSIWIDAETKLRSDEGRSFDLAKAEEFLARATLWEQRRLGKGEVG